MTAEQIEKKKQRLHQLALDAQAICKELVNAGALELSEDDLDKVAGGWMGDPSQLTGIEATLQRLFGPGYQPESSKSPDSEIDKALSIINYGDKLWKSMGF